LGKLDTENLKKLLACIKKHPKVIVPPLPGFDSGVHLLNDKKYLVVSTDPCLGVPPKWFGWLLIHYAASDVALFGAKPEFCTLNLLGPLQTSPETFIEIMNKACKAAAELRMAVATGHTGTYKGISTLIGVCTAYGTINKKKLITPGDARSSDRILCIKPLGLEAVVNFAIMHRLARRLFGTSRARELSKLVNMQSCVKEALLLAEAEGVHAMHDATEGGLTAALNEVAEASKVGFRIDSEAIPIAKEAYSLQKYFSLTNEQMLSMSSTGTLLAAISSDKTTEILKNLCKNGFEARIIGVFTKDMKRILVRNGKEERFPQIADDPYEKIFSEEM
jgi:hydrogenase maturation factor